MSLNQPEWRVTLDGKDLTSIIAPRLISLRLNEKRGGEADQLDIVVDDSDGRLALPSRGALIAVQLGWLRGPGLPIGLIDKGSFKVDEVEHSGPPDQITIRARSADLTSSFRRRRSRSWKQTTLGAIARLVAADHGWQANVHASLAGVTVEVIGQDQKSDMALLRKLGAEHDAVATVKHGKLILSPIGVGTSPGGHTFGALIIPRTAITRHAFRVVDRDQSAGVESVWHDQASGTRKTVRVGSGSGTPKRLRRVYHSHADAHAAAQSEHGRSLRSAYTLDIDLGLGRPDIFPDRPITVTGIKAGISDRKWLVAEVSHSLDSNGLTSSLMLETHT